MVPVESLSPGMRVKIVDQWVDGCGQNYDGRMDNHLGHIVTILDVCGGIAHIEEDAGECPTHLGGHWVWNGLCFDHIVEDEIQEEFEPSSKSEIFSFIFGN